MKRTIEIEVGRYCEECSIYSYINKWYSCPVCPSYRRGDYTEFQYKAIKFMDSKLKKFESLCTKEDFDKIKEIIKKEED